MISDPNRNHGKLTQFRVQLGHNCVIVPGATREQAIDEARRRFSEDLPRLWDVIHSLTADRFVVSPIP